MQETSTGAAVEQPLTTGVEVGEIRGKRLFLEFAAFGFFKRTCQLELRANGDSVISKGVVATENGAWRIEVCGVCARIMGALWTELSLCEPGCGFCLLFLVSTL